MKNAKQKFYYNNTGITLVALVVTIVILLILSGVSINLVLGENGLIKRATSARDETAEAQEKEGIELAISSAKLANNTYQNLNQQNLQEALNNQFGNGKAFSQDNGDGSYTIKFYGSDRLYYIESSEKIIENKDTVKISTVNELKAFRDQVNSGNTFAEKYVYLTNDITLDIDEEWEPIGVYLDSNTSISDETNSPFCGIFDGNGYAINNLKITSSEKGKGFFGLVKNATIKNLGIANNCLIENVGNCSAGIVGYSYLNTTIENCYNKSNVYGVGQQIGGIIGNCGSSSIVKKCYNEGEISTESGNVGGIAGNNAGTIEECYNCGNIFANASSTAGGIIGLLSGSVNNCYNSGDIYSGIQYSGGIAGLMYANDSAIILNSYSYGNINASNLAGGIVGGIVKGNVENSYFLENTVNGVNIGNTPRTSEELKALSGILGSYFSNDVNNINNGYPILNWQSIV